MLLCGVEDSLIILVFLCESFELLFAFSVDEFVLLLAIFAIFCKFISGAFSSEVPLFTASKTLFPLRLKNCS